MEEVFQEESVVLKLNTFFYETELVGREILAK